MVNGTKMRKIFLKLGNNIRKKDNIIVYLDKI